MLVKLNGVVIRSIKYGETSLIFDMYTDSFGLCSFIVNGARKPRSKLPASLFQLTNWLELVVYFKEPRTLNRVKEAQLIFHYSSIPFDLHKSSVALFLTEVTQKTMKENEANAALYDFIFGTFRDLDLTTGPVRDIHLLFLLRLSQYLGFSPQNNWSAHEPYFNLISGNFAQFDHPLYTLDRELSGLMKDYLAHVQDQVGLPPTSREMRRKLLIELLNFYRYHLDKFPEIKTHKILAEVLS